MTLMASKVECSRAITRVLVVESVVKKSCEELACLRRTNDSLDIKNKGLTKAWRSPGLLIEKMDGEMNHTSKCFSVNKTSIVGGAPRGNSCNLPYLIWCWVH